MSSNHRRGSNDQDSALIKREQAAPVNKLMIKVRSRAVKRPKCRSKLIVMASAVSAMLLLVGIFVVISELSSESEDKIYGVYGGFLIDGPACKIPNMNPFAKEAMKVFKREKFEPCSTKRPLTTVSQNFENDTVQLTIHNDRKKEYLAWWQSDVKCCYERITRAGFNDTADSEVDYSDCKPFHSSSFLDPEDEFVLVSCFGYKKILSWQPDSLIYRNAHAVVRSKPDVKRKLLEQPSSDKISVFLMGIDSISRLNLIRGMPKTYEHLEENGWFEMRGFNKIGDNTFPNLMAILTGQNESLTDEICNWRNVGQLDNCSFIWKDFDAAGYATAYAEDETSINTFNYYETGFIQQPTDYYLRPFALGSENFLKIKLKHKRMICLGYQHYADHIYQYGLDFAVKYKDNPSFGLFWTNSFSHEDLSMSSAMDARVKFYLQQLEKLEILDNSIVLFFSDHGMRFGPIRKQFIGWVEERLPFFYIWLPEKFRLAHPEIVRNLRINRDRLSSMYDVHLTLKHILQLSGGYDQEPSAVSCPDCQSLFKELPINRTCSDAGIDKHWCTCVEFKEVDKKTKTVAMAVNYIINDVNIDLMGHPKCAKLKLKEIHSARQSKHKSSTDYLVSFNVQPSNAELEATVRCDDECENFKIIGSVSRLNRYGNQSWCVNDAVLRKYCYCK